jgi:hypothetical protein
MAITDTDIIQKYLNEYNVWVEENQLVSSIFVYETASADRSHYKKEYLTAKDINYYANENLGIRTAVFLEDPELLDADNVYTEVME